MKRYLNKLMQELSLLGKAMLVPITVMPVAGIIGLIFGADFLNIPVIAGLSSIVFGNVDFLFVLGAAGAYSKAKDKTTVMVGAVVAFLVFKQTLGTLTPDLNAGVFGGILVGIAVAYTYNHTHKLKAPAVLSFFANEKCVVSLSPLIGLAFAWLFSIIWIYPQNAMDAFGVWLGGMGAFGVFLFIFLNRALIPLGLHQVLNAYILFEMGSYTNAAGEVVHGEIPRFMAGDPTAGWFWTGFYVIMMFGIPAIALAIYKTAREDRKKEVKGVMTAGAVTAFASTVTEPVEFSFLFASPKLYLLHSLYSGLGGAILVLSGSRLGTFNGAGILDYTLCFRYGDRAWMVIPVGIVFFLLYYITFKKIIIRDQVETPGRERELELSETAGEEEKQLKLSHSNYAYMAKKLLQNCGGQENIVSVANCLTRLRLEVKDAGLLNDENIKKTGAKGVIRLNNNSVQIVIGTEVKYVREEFEMQLEELRKQAED